MPLAPLKPPHGDSHRAVSETHARRRPVHTLLDEAEQRLKPDGQPRRQRADPPHRDGAPLA